MTTKKPVSKKPKSNWSPEEIAYLKANLWTLTDNMLAEDLGRTPGAIRIKLSYLRQAGAIPAEARNRMNAATVKAPATSPKALSIARNEMISEALYLVENSRMYTAEQVTAIHRGIVAANQEPLTFWDPLRLKPLAEVIAVLEQRGSE